MRGNCFERARSRTPKPASLLGNCDHALRFVEHVGEDGGDMNRNISTVNARRMRKNLTDAEKKLWRYLRLKNIEGSKFRRQHPIGKYIVDFVCLEMRLIVEVDGGQHGEQIAYDNERTQWLESEGYRVLRFWNNEVLEDVEVVAEEIVQALEMSG